jgi:hypothetical protein
MTIRAGIAAIGRRIEWPASSSHAEHRLLAARVRARANIVLPGLHRFRTKLANGPNASCYPHQFGLGVLARNGKRIAQQLSVNAFSRILDSFHSCLWEARKEAVFSIQMRMPGSAEGRSGFAGGPWLVLRPHRKRKRRTARNQEIIATKGRTPARASQPERRQLPSPSSARPRTGKPNPTIVTVTARTGFALNFSATSTRPTIDRNPRTGNSARIQQATATTRNRTVRRPCDVFSADRGLS